MATNVAIARRRARLAGGFVPQVAAAVPQSEEHAIAQIRWFPVREPETIGSPRWHALHFAALRPRLAAQTRRRAVPYAARLRHSWPFFLNHNITNTAGTCCSSAFSRPVPAARP